MVFTGLKEVPVIQKISSLWLQNTGSNTYDVIDRQYYNSTMHQSAVDRLITM